MCWSEQQTYPGQPSSSSAARMFTITCLGQILGNHTSATAAINDAALVVSELVTNAINARATKVTVDVTIHHDHLRLAVSDNAYGRPEPRSSSPTATGGRGLRIVEQLVRGWGTVTGSDGKQVWAELSLDPVATAPLKCKSLPASEQPARPGPFGPGKEPLESS
jgi:anti-sigma regulatory factor (Ser/Thr protein kinase)